MKSQKKEKYNDYNIDEVFGGSYDDSPALAPAPELETTQKKRMDTYGGETKFEQDTVSEKCPNCGDLFEYDPAAGQMVCHSCGTVEEIAKARTFTPRDVEFGDDTLVKWGNETRVFKCASCGAQTIFAAHEFAKDCAFCGSPNVAVTAQIEGVRPDALIPFTLTHQNARECYTKWIRKRFFAPGRFKLFFDENTMKGIYSPCWVFDASTYNRYSGIAGKYYTVTVGSGKNRRTERRIRYFPVSGSLSKDFSDVIIEASSHLTQKDVERLKPFPQSQMVDYDKRFMMGYIADHYDRSLKDSWSDARRIIEKDVASEARRQVLRRADVVQSLNVYTDYVSKKYKYALLPVYVIHVKYKEKNYNLFVNGSTGRTTGKYPKSGGKIAVLIAVITGFLVGMGALAYWIVMNS